MIIVEGPQKVMLGGRAEVIEDDRELAWAEKYVRRSSDLAWVQGNFVCADTANYNGHVFPLEDLREAHKDIQHKPLNLLHRSQQIVGVFVGSELLYPTRAADAAPAEAASAPPVPYVEALAAFYRYYFPETYQAVRASHAEGSLFFSMECVPKSLTCMGTQGGGAGCGREFDYRGRQHDSYCDHLNGKGAVKRMNKPRFTAGALVIPPAKPGWKDADVTALSQLLEDSVVAEAAYEQIAAETPHLTPLQWETLMATLVLSAEGRPAGGFSPDQVTGMARTGVALADGRWPIPTLAALHDALADYETATVEDRAVLRPHALKRAKALGAEELIPERWK